MGETQGRRPCYNVLMRYSLWSLMIAGLVGPPILSVLYFILFARNSPAFSIALVLGMAAAIVFVSIRIALRGEFSDP